MGSSGTLKYSVVDEEFIRRVMTILDGQTTAEQQNGRDCAKNSGLRTTGRWHSRGSKELELGVPSYNADFPSKRQGRGGEQYLWPAVPL